MCTLCKFDKTVDTSSSRALLYQWIIGIHRQDMEDVWHTKTDTIALRIRSPSRECCRRCFKSILLYQGLPMRTQNTETILTININQSLFLKSTVFVFRTVFIFLAYSCDTNFSSTFCSFQIFSDAFSIWASGKTSATSPLQSTWWLYRNQKAKPHIASHESKLQLPFKTSLSPSLMNRHFAQH